MRYLIVAGALLLVVGCSAERTTAPPPPLQPHDGPKAKDFEILWVCPVENGFVIRTGWEPGCELYAGG